MKNTFEECLYRNMKSNKRIVTFFADSDFKYYDDFAREFPGRFFNFGIAEQNMVGAAAGMAKSSGGDLIPVVYTVGAFLSYRAYEFIRDDICIPKLNVKVVGMGAGVKINNYGPTHHSTEDIAVLSVLPNLTLLSPASPKEVPVIFEECLKHNGATYIRLGKAFETEIHNDIPGFEIGKNSFIQYGNDLTIIATGSIISNAIDAANLLQNEGITSDIINVTSIKPLDENTIIKSILKTKRVVTIEEHQITGGLGSIIADILATHNISAAFEKVGFRDTFCKENGWHRDLLKAYKLSSDDIFQVCKSILKK